MTDEFPRGAASTTQVGCRSYVHSEPPRRKGLKISGLLVSRPTAVELMPPQRPRLPIGATLCSARRPPLSIFLATAASPAATTAAAASASTPPFQLLMLRRVAAAADVILVVVQWGGAGHQQPRRWPPPLGRPLDLLHVRRCCCRRKRRRPTTSPRCFVHHFFR